MTGDHVNKALFAGALPVLSELARVCFPAFAGVLAWNLLRAGNVGRVIRRLLFIGSLAQPFHAIAFGAFLPLNILFTFALGAFLCACLNRRQWDVAGVAFVALGGLVDYQWFGAALFVSFWLLFQAAPGHRIGPALAVVAALASLQVTNGNAWAFLVIPLVAVAVAVRASVPRYKWVFWVYYPAHLALLATLVLFAAYRPAAV